MIRSHGYYVKKVHEKYPDVDKQWISEITTKYMRYMVGYIFQDEGFHGRLQKFFFCVPKNLPEDSSYRRIKALRVERDLKKKMRKYV